MLTFDPTTAVNQSLVSNLISASSTSGNFSVQDFESELAGLIGQIFTQTSGASTTSAATAGTGTASAAGTGTSNTASAAASSSQDSGATNSGTSGSGTSNTALTNRSTITNSDGTSNTATGQTSSPTTTGASSSTTSSSTSASPYSAATLAAAAQAAAISPVASEFGITTMPAAQTFDDEVVQSGGLIATQNGGIPAATSSTPVLDTYAMLVAKNEANTAALEAAAAGSSSSSSSTSSTSSSASSSSNGMVEMWDPWNNTLDGPLVPASGVMLTNPTTGQQVDSGAVFAAYENYYPNNNALMLADMQATWGKAATNLWVQQNPSANPASGDPTATPTVFQEIGPYNPFFDPNNGGSLAIFDSSGTEYLV